MLRFVLSPQRVTAGLTAALLLAGLSGWRCEHTASSSTQNPSPSLSSARYVGIDSCRTCHADVYADFIHTGMGQSFHEAVPSESKARFPSPPVYDANRKAYFRAFLRNDSIFIEEFRIDPVTHDTFYRRVQPLTYIVGSGQHTNSHIYSANGFLYQAPLTFYTQAGLWDLPPGFHGMKALRWERPIGLACMSCHNAHPDFDSGSINRFRQVPTGIDCERCHGPGSLHVERRRKGLPLLDNNREIVHPARLSPDRQMDLCQRCHLQGLSILRPGKSYEDFIPGMRLADVWNVYYARTWMGDSFLMASHPARLKMSRCYMASRERSDVPDMTCLTCHNPHHSVRQTPVETFTAKCLGCHQTKDCPAPRQEDNCIRCHMPESAPYDIPHVRIHDHFIRVPGRTNPDLPQPIVISMIDSAPPPAERARAILEFIERMNAPHYLLDSAEKTLEGLPPRTYPNEWIYYTFLRGQYALTTAIVSRGRLNEDSLRPFTLYRIGEAYLQMKNPRQARYFFNRAAQKLPAHPPFYMKTGITWLQQRQPQRARDFFRKAVELDPAYPTAWNNLGFAYLLIGHLDSAAYCLQKAYLLAPDNPHVWANLLKLYFIQGNQKKYDSLKTRIKHLFPNNQMLPRVWQLLENANSSASSSLQ